MCAPSRDGNITTPTMEGFCGSQERDKRIILHIEICRYAHLHINLFLRYRTTVTKDRRTDRAAGLSRGWACVLGSVHHGVGAPSNHFIDDCSGSFENLPCAFFKVVAINWCSMRATPSHVSRFLGQLIRMDGVLMKFPSQFLGGTLRYSTGLCWKVLLTYDTLAMQQLFLPFIKVLVLECW